MTVAKLIDARFNVDGLYRISAPDLVGPDATLVIVRSGVAYGVNLTDLDDPAALRDLLTNAHIVLERIG